MQSASFWGCGRRGRGELVLSYTILSRHYLTPLYHSLSIMADFSPFSLSSLDHALLAVYIPQNLCFRTSDHQQCLSRLQAGINLLLTRLPFLSGEIVPRTDHGAKPGELRVQPGNTFDAIPMLTIKHFTDVSLPPVLIGGSNSLKTDHAVASLDSQFFPLPLILPPSEPRPVICL